MIFKRLIIEDGLFDASDDTFSKNSNLLFSKDNSVGKTTYLRILLYAFGYTIPDMFGMNFSNLKLELQIEENNVLYTIKRIKDVLHVFDGQTDKNYILPSGHIDFLADIFNTKNNDVLENLLGLMYIDQEKGWTLLNRGTVIGRNKFNIEILLSGLGEIDCKNEIESRDYYEEENKKANALLNMKQLQEQILENNNDFVFTDYEKELNNKIELCNINISRIKDSIKKINDVIRKNTNIYDYISQLNLYVVDSNGNEIKVNSGNLRNANETNKLLEYRIKYLSIDLKNEERKLTELKNKQNDYYINNGRNRLFVTDEIIDSEIAKKSIANLDIDAVAIKAIVKQNKENIEKNNNAIKDKLLKNFELNGMIYEQVKRYCKELEISDIILSDQKFLFTNKIKHYSGTDFSKLVIAFRLALHKATENYLNTHFPFIVDSPTGREMTHENYTRIIKLINSELKDSQLIYASIKNEIQSNKKFTFLHKAIEKH